MRSTLVVYVALLLALASASWTGPIQLYNDSHELSVSSMYRDPTSSIIHVVVNTADSAGTLYYALSASGTILYQAQFPQWADRTSSIIRGAGDGKRLFIAMPHYIKQAYTKVVYFTESSDGGKTWKEPTAVFADAEYRELADMIYIVETDCIFLFYGKESQLMFATRPSGSAAFKEAAQPIDETLSSDTAKAAYSVWLDKIIIHLAYESTKQMLAYTRSFNNGKQWEPSRVLGNSEGVFLVANMVALGSAVRLVYTSRHDYRGSMLMHSNDYGKTFEGPISMTKRFADNSCRYHGVSLCSAGNSLLMAAVIVKRGTSLEYALWDSAAGMKPLVRDHVITEEDMTSAKAECYVSGESTLEVVTLTAQFVRPLATLYFAKETVKLPLGLQKKQQ